MRLDDRWRADPLVASHGVSRKVSESVGKPISHAAATAETERRAAIRRRDVVHILTCWPTRTIGSQDAASRRFPGLSPCRCYARASHRRRSSSRRRSPAVLRPQIAAAEDLRRPGGDRDRERAAVQGAGSTQSRSDRGAGAADGDERDPAGHRRARRPTSSRCSTPSLRTRRSCASASRVVYRFDGELIAAGGACMASLPEGLEIVRHALPEASRRDRHGARDLARERRAVPDVLERSRVRARGSTRGRRDIRSVLAYPIVRDGDADRRRSSSARARPGRSPTSRSSC